MDNATLVRPDTESGQQLLPALDAAGFEVKAAFWYYLEEAEEWRLYIATPLVKQIGPRAVYSRVLNILKEKHIQGIDLAKISVVDETDSLVTVLRLAGPFMSNVQFNGESVNGVYIRAAYIYRIV